MLLAEAGRNILYLMILLSRRKFANTKERIFPGVGAIVLNYVTALYLAIDMLKENSLSGFSPSWE